MKANESSKRMKQNFMCEDGRLVLTQTITKDITSYHKGYDKV